jgi:hypothetical protein
MPIGEKLFEEDGQAMGFKIAKVHPVEGTTMEVSAASILRDSDDFRAVKSVLETDFRAVKSVLETEFDPQTQKVHTVGYEWKS